ncbi:MAG: ABC-2 transporter permease [Lachnospiraceae bacterium]|nr:ABC-2 transporter permease [Lachnospiraceae bacterium]
MKQLICRDLWLCRKRIAPYIVIVLLFLIPVSMVILSARFGNIAKYRGEGAAALLDSLESLGLFAGILVLCSIETVGSLNLSDHLSGWYQYLKASGMKSSRIVGQKYIDVAILLVISWLTGLLANALIGLLAGREAADVGLMSVVMGLMLIYLEYNILLGFATKGKRSDLMMILPILFILAAEIAFFGYGAGHKDFGKMLMDKIMRFMENRPLLYAVTLFAVVLFSVLNYSLSVYFFDREIKIKRKEENR